MHHRPRRSGVALRAALPAPRYLSRRSACARATLRRSDEISGCFAAADFFAAGLAPAFFAAGFRFAAFVFAAIARLLTSTAAHDRGDQSTRSPKMSESAPDPLRAERRAPKQERASHSLARTYEPTHASEARSGAASLRAAERSKTGRSAPNPAEASTFEKLDQ
jgi:hypothetical protein